MKAPGSMESDESSRPTEDGVRGSAGFTGEASSVGSRETALTPCPHEGQKRPDFSPNLEILADYAAARKPVIFLCRNQHDIRRSLAIAAESKLVYFSGIDKCRFRQPVGPGDQIRLEVGVMRSRERYYRMRGEAFVNGTLVAEAELSCAVVPRS